MISEKRLREIEQEPLLFFDTKGALAELEELVMEIRRLRQQLLEALGPNHPYLLGRGHGAKE